MTRWIQRAHSNRFLLWFLILFTHKHTHILATHTRAHRFTHTDRFGYLICQVITFKVLNLFFAVVVQLLSPAWLFMTPRTAAHRASLSVTLPWIFPSFMCTESVMVSHNVILSRPLSSCLQSFPASGSFPMSQLFASGGQSTEFQLQHQSFQWTPRTDLL